MNISYFTNDEEKVAIRPMAYLFIKDLLDKPQTPGAAARRWEVLHHILFPWTLAVSSLCSWQRVHHSLLDWGTLITLSSLNCSASVRWEALQSLLLLVALAVSVAGLSPSAYQQLWIKNSKDFSPVAIFLFWGVCEAGEGTSLAPGKNKLKMVRKEDLADSSVMLLSNTLFFGGGGIHDPSFSGRGVTSLFPVFVFGREHSMYHLLILFWSIDWQGGLAPKDLSKLVFYFPKQVLQTAASDISHHYKDFNQIEIKVTRHSYMKCQFWADLTNLVVFSMFSQWHWRTPLQSGSQRLSRAQVKIMILVIFF